MRLLKEEKQREMNEYILQFIRKHSNYNLTNNSIRVINGTEEGEFLWLTVNYLLGRFESRRFFTLNDSNSAPAAHLLLDLSSVYWILSIGSAVLMFALSLGS